MKYIYAERNYEFTPDVKVYAEKKLAKLDKFFRADAEAAITARTERGHICLEVTVRNDGMLLRAACRDTDVFRAVDTAQATIERQIRKNKTRLERRLRDGAFENLLPVDDEALEEEREFPIVRTKRFSVKPMTAEEAILQMNLLDHAFFAFKNANDERFSVVYKRHDGGYGLIEDE